MTTTTATAAQQRAALRRQLVGELQDLAEAAGRIADALWHFEVWARAASSGLRTDPGNVSYLMWRALRGEDRLPLEEEPMPQETPVTAHEGRPRPPIAEAGPNGERLWRCRTCNAWCYWGTTSKGRPVPISLATGVSHFADCKDAAGWTRKKPKGSAA